MRSKIVLLAALTAINALPVASRAQDSDREDRDSRVRTGIIFGDAPRVDGVRINFRDANLRRVRGMNITLWTPYDDAFEGRITGVALGLPSTGGGDMTGLSVAPLGLGFGGDVEGLTIAGVGAGAGGDLGGVSVAGIGFGAGGDLRGLSLAGIGVGAGGDLRGVTIGGIGAAAGGDIRGLVAGGVGAAVGGGGRAIMIGGVGAGVGGSLRGAAVGGVGVGAGGDVRGLLIGGVGAGVGGDLTGIVVTGVGAGAGGEISGFSVAGLGMGAGSRVHGLAIAGLGIGSPELSGLIVAPLVGAQEARAIIISPAHFRTERGAEISGGTLSAVSLVRGHMNGLAIGVVNYAESLRGFQVGVINIVRDNPAGRRVLPIINWN